MKCRLLESHGKCERCKRKSLDCTFRKHQRGRRPAVKRAANAMISNPEDTNEADGIPTTITESLTDSGRYRPSSERQHGEEPANARAEADKAFWAESDNFRPSDLLNREATSGHFSLLNILSTTNRTGTPAPSDSSSDNPIQMRLINYIIAVTLFDGFMKHLNPYICQLDPIMHTFAYVQTTSSFLLTAILTASAKSMNPAVYPALKDHAETLFSRSFRRGQKSAEVVQAILILTYWKELDDTRAWLSVGYAIRLSMELGWHKLSKVQHENDHVKTDLERRTLRNCQRTWLVLFVYDRSISLQTGKPRMIERSEFIESVEIWLKHDLALPMDVLLGAFVSLRLLTSDVFDVLEPSSTTDRALHVHGTDALLKSLGFQIRTWEDHWIRLARTAACETCHLFLIRFYGMHLQLLLSSFSLRPALLSQSTEAKIRIGVIWSSNATAIQMLKLVSDPAVSPILYFAQDSVHVMIAYAAVFLIKLLFCVPKHARADLETMTIEALRDAARSFAHQAAPPNSSCWLQAKFLENVLNDYSRPSRLRTETNDLAEAGRVAPHQHSRTRAHNEADSSALHQEMEGADAHGEQSQLLNDTISPDFALWDDDMWEPMFASAGFNITDGTFLADAYTQA
ncbi:hypothetical protein PV11_01867 [Exophiala sideris]|uniref:Xylanolytic transcriptional activator regulatory domain-containing protein n=1 Tax=Exophiala sideris TaxID=1016849 RepID=A0A0D1YXF8_9EURO|nr:hypothetical protein PV11_01867 [Exophiala sideris]